MTDANEQRPVAIVTGISKGFGREIARSLVSAGWTVIGDARNVELLMKVTAEIDAGGGVIPVPGDITDRRHIANLVVEARSAGALQLIVNNAGDLGPSPMPLLANLNLDDLEVLFQVNTIASARLIQSALSDLNATNGVVINITSDAAVEAYAGWGAYSATKAALEQLTSTFAAECPNLRFYALDPGDMRTDMHQAAFVGQDISDRPSPNVSAPAILSLISSGLPSGRYRARDFIPV